MKKIISTLIVAFICTVTFAQQKTESVISGKTNPASTIFLLAASDSLMVKTAVADAAGNYTIPVSNKGSYLVKITSTGYQTAWVGPFVIDQDAKQVSAATRMLQPEAMQMAAVVVTSKKPVIEQQIDKTVFNVDALISSTGSTALEVLEKAPGVIVDKDGNISLKGKQGVTIMMDGKPTYLSGTELISLLSSLPASSISKIELMTNPSAKYDAAGNSGIIDIKTKKTKQKGFNGSVAVAYGQGIYSKTNNSLQLNYRVNKFNIFSSFGGNYRRESQQLDINRKYFTADNNLSSTFAQKTFKQNERYYNSAKIGADYYASKNTTIGIVFSGFSAPDRENGGSLSILRNNMSVVDSMVDASRREKSFWHNGAVNFNVRHTIDTTGKEITADFDIIKYNSGNDQFFVNSVLAPSGNLLYSDVLSGDLPSNINIYSAKVDYTQKLPGEIKMETGVKFSYVNTDNMANYYNVENGIEKIDWDKTNHFTYKENINAAYVSLSKSINKWGLQAGLRAENTNLEGNQFGNPLPTHPDSSFRRSYTNLFPTTYISYKKDDNNNFGFSYGRRIERPDYESLNPFLYFIDKYTSDRGNPFLKPVYAHVLELSYNYKRLLNASVNYRYNKDLINNAFVEEGFNIINSKDNYGSSNSLSLNVNLTKQIMKGWKTMMYNELNYQDFKGITANKDLLVKGTYYMANINNQFEFKNGWSAELSAFYRSRTKEAQVTVNGIWQAGAAVKKDVLKGKGSIKLSARDMFGPMKVTGNLNFAQTQADFSQSRDSRVFTIGFNYRFGKPIKGLKSRKSGGAADEQNRVKGGE